MPSWSEIVNHIGALGNNNPEINKYLNESLDEALKQISIIRENRNIIFYASSFLQKPQLDPMAIQITNEEINGLMAVMHGMDFTKGLCLILHTPGGVTNATETIVEYIHSKFPYIEVIIPTFAMSAGTMISLSADLIIMGKPSQMGPIDPQMIINGKSISARAVIDQFDKAKKEIHENILNAHVWAPILGAMGPGLLIEAEKASDYSEKIVEAWLKRKGYKNAEKIAHHFNSPSIHKSHGKRIDKKEVEAQGLRVEELEANQKLQENVLTAYHLVTVLFEKSPAAKMMISNNHGKRWVKNVIMQPNIPLPFPLQGLIK